MWVVDVLKGQFFWGVVVGLLVALVGAYAQARFQQRRKIKLDRADARTLCRDIVTNIMSICEHAKTAKDGKKPFHHDLQLLDAEVMVFARIRHETVRLDEALRTKVRLYIMDCALGQADVARSLSDYDRHSQNAVNVRAAGVSNQAVSEEAKATRALEEARASLDRLVVRAKDGTEIIDGLQGRPPTHAGA